MFVGTASVGRGLGLGLGSDPVPWPSSGLPSSYQSVRSQQSVACSVEPSDSTHWMSGSDV